MSVEQEPETAVETAEETPDVEASYEYPIDDYIADTYGRPVSWVLVAQYLDEDDGQRYVAIDTSGETHLWEIQGLLNYAMNDANGQQAEAQLFGSISSDEDDDD